MYAIKSFILAVVTSVACMAIVITMEKRTLFEKKLFENWMWLGITLFVVVFCARMFDKDYN